MQRTVDTDRLYRDLARIVGERRVAVREADLLPYGRDMWPRLLLRQNRTPYRSHAVVWPENVREVAAVVRAARELRLPIVPYGGGSGVCGGAVPIRGGITVDLKRMDDLLAVDDTDMVCDVEAGMNGERFERALHGRGFTAGHFPSSIYCSTVGGWLACRAAGQMSTKYGKIEDRVVGMTVVSGRGDILKTDEFPRASAGPNWVQLLCGSEGTLGIITSARLRISPSPALRVFRGYEFADVKTGVEAIRRVLQRGLRPAVVRLYDDVDTLVHRTAHDRGERLLYPPLPKPGQGALPPLPKGGSPDKGSRFRRALDVMRADGKKLKQNAMNMALSRPRALNLLLGQVAERTRFRGCLMIVGLEGAAIRTEVESQLTFAELEHAGGRDLGEEPGRHWLENRYGVSYAMSKVFEGGSFVDTMEVACSWERLLDLYQLVKEAISRHAFVMAHFSHAYHDGCSIYFTFVGHGDSPEESERTYDAIWQAGMAAVGRAGGTISHHHGVGLLKAPYMSGEHREALGMLFALKNALDPDGILNPGKLGIPERA